MDGEVRVTRLVTTRELIQPRFPTIRDLVSYW